jgi:hypothetical protein
LNIGPEPITLSTLQKIEADHGFMKADMIILNQVNINERNILTITNKEVLKDYNVCFCSGDEQVAGQLCLSRKAFNKQINVLAQNGELINGKNMYSSKKSNQFSIFRITQNSGDLFICLVFAPVVQNRMNFYQELKKFVRKYMNARHDKGQPIKINSKFVIIGNFNIDYQKRNEPNFDISNKEFIEKILNKFPGKMSFKHNSEFKYTTIDRQLLDWCIINDKINMSNLKSQVYESYFTFHKPIWVSFLI